MRAIVTADVQTDARGLRMIHQRENNAKPYFPTCHEPCRIRGTPREAHGTLLGWRSNSWPAWSQKKNTKSTS